MVPEGDFISLTAGDEHTCGLTSVGNVDCWGVGGGGQTSPPTTTFTQIETTEDLTCGLTPAGTVECWGCCDHTPCDVMPEVEGTFTQISVGTCHVCGVDAAGSITCFGEYVDESDPL